MCLCNIWILNHTVPPTFHFCLCGLFLRFGSFRSHCRNVFLPPGYWFGSFRSNCRDVFLAPMCWLRGFLSLHCCCLSWRLHAIYNIVEIILKVCLLAYKGFMSIDLKLFRKQNTMYEGGMHISGYLDIGKINFQYWIFA